MTDNESLTDWNNRNLQAMLERCITKGARQLCTIRERESVSGALG
jgi:hypothetical protein